MKNILFMIDSLECGGAEKSLVSLLGKLDRSKYHLVLWIRKRGGVFESLLPQDVEVVSEPRSSILNSLCLFVAQKIYSLRYRMQRMMNIHEHGAQLLWKTAGPFIPYPKGHYDVAIAYQTGIPMYLLAEKIRAEKKLSWINGDMEKVFYSMEYSRLFYLKNHSIVFVSQKLQDLLGKKVGIGREKQRVIYDILDPQLIGQLAQVPVDFPGSSASRAKLVTVGRLMPQKGYDLAVHAAAILRKKGCDFCWYFIGEGPYRKEIEQMIAAQGLEDHVMLLGLKDNPYPYMAGCDIYVQPSYWEGFGLTVGEAKILGKPIVATDFDVIHHQLTHRKNGLIVSMAPQSIADGVMELLRDPGLGHQFRQALALEKNTTSETEVKKVEALLDED